MNILEDIDALLVSIPENIQYLTGFTSAEPHAREAYGLITKKTLYLFTNALYTEQARKLPTKTLLGTPLEVMEISADKPLSDVLLLISQKEKLSCLGFEDVDLTVAEHARFTTKLNTQTFVPTRLRIEQLRMNKRPKELTAIKNACKLTDDCFDMTIQLLKPGVYETDIAWEIESFFKKHGAGLAFSPIVAFGKNSSQPHYQGTNNKKLNSTDIVLLDFGARVHGYCADMTRVMFIGTPKDEWKNAYEAVANAQTKALSLLSEGTRSGARLDAAARDELKKKGFDEYPHSLGHNVGLAIHELPRLSIKKDATLTAGMVFSIEPGLYKEGKYGIRIEDLVLLTDTGIEVLSHAPKSLTIL